MEDVLQALRTVVWRDAVFTGLRRWSSGSDCDAAMYWAGFVTVLECG